MIKRYHFFLSLTIFFMLLSTSTIKAIRSFRGAVMSPKIPDQSLFEVSRNITQELEDSIPLEVRSVLKIVTRKSTIMPSTISILVDFKTEEAQAQYTPLLDLLLKKHLPLKHEIRHELSPGDYGVCIVKKDEKEKPRPYSSEPINIEKPRFNFPTHYNAPDVISSSHYLSDNVHLSVSFRPESHRANAYFAQWEFLASAPPSYFADMFAHRPRDAFEEFGLYQFQGFRRYVENQPGFARFVWRLKEKIATDIDLSRDLESVPGFEGSLWNQFTEFITFQKNKRFHNYVNNCVDHFYGEMLNRLRSEEQAKQYTLERAKARHKLINDACDLIRDRGENLIDCLDEKLESLSQCMIDDELHLDIYQASLQMIDNAHNSYIEQNTTVYDRSLSRLESLLESLENESVIESRAYQIDEKLLDACGIDMSDMKINTGMPIQNRLHEEYISLNHNIAVLDTLASIEPTSQPISEGMTALIDSYLHLARGNSLEKNFEQSFALHDTCWEMIDIARKGTLANMHMYRPGASQIQPRHDLFYSRVISSLEAIKSGSIKGVELFCNQAIDDLKTLVCNPVGFVTDYAKSLRTIGKGLYNTGYFVFCMDGDEKYNAIVRKYNSIEDYFANSSAENIIEDTTALLTNIGLSIITGRTNKLIRGKILKTAGKIAQAISTEEQLRKCLSPCHKSIKKLRGGARYSMERMLERRIKYTHKLSGLEDKALKKSSQTIKYLETKFRTEKNFMKSFNDKIGRLEKRYPHLDVRHVVMGDFAETGNGLSKLRGGCHTLDGLLYAIKKLDIILKILSLSTMIMVLFVFVHQEAS